MSASCWHPTESDRFAIAGEDKYVDLWDVRGILYLNDFNVYSYVLVLIAVSIIIASRAAGRVVTTVSNLFLSWSPDENYIAVGSKVIWYYNYNAHN